MWPLDYTYPTLAQAEQAIGVIWARLSALAGQPVPTNDLFARAVYTALGYALSVGTDGIVPHEAQSDNPEARLKELLNPYFGQPIGTNMGAHVGGEHPRFPLGNINWQSLLNLLLGIAKNFGNLPIPPTPPSAPSGGEHLLPLPTAFALENDTGEKSHLPGYPPRNIPE